MLTAFSLISPWIFGVNLGIDMTGGIQIEYSVESGNIQEAQNLARVTADEIGKSLQIEGKSLMNGTTVYGIAGSSAFVVEAGFAK